MLLRRENLARLFLALLAAPAAVAFAAESDPTPPKADVPYMIYAGNLAETEHHEATEQRRDKRVTYTIPGATSPVRTPLAGPEFLLLSEDMDPGVLRLYGVESGNGRREISFRENRPKQNPQAHILSVFPVSDGLFRLRVDDSLERGEYCLTPEGTNDVFCFTVF